MIFCRRIPSVIQAFVQIVNSLRSCTVYDPCLFPVRLHIPVQVLALPSLRLIAPDGKTQILPTVSGVDAKCICKPQLLLHPGPYAWRRRSRKRRDRRPFSDLLKEFRDPQIIRTEIISPQRNTVCLVHNKKGEFLPSCETYKFRRRQPLRRYIDQFTFAVIRFLHDPLALPGWNRTVQTCGLYPVSPKMLNLILHQCDQRRYNQCNSRKFHCRILIADRFTAPRRHDSQHIPAR